MRTMRNFRSKKIWLDYDKTMFCIVHVFNKKREMQEAYSDIVQGRCQKVKGVYTTLGVHIPHLAKKGHTGTVLLSRENCGAGIVSHEFGHAALYAFNIKSGEQHPIVINSMKAEEKILHMQTNAVSAFYRWYWKHIHTCQV